MQVQKPIEVVQEHSNNQVSSETQILSSQLNYEEKYQQPNEEEKANEWHKQVFQYLEKLKQKYKDSKIISTYLNLPQNSCLQDFFNVNMTQAQIQAFRNQKILGCRVILLLLILTTEKKYSKISHNSPELKQILDANQFKEVIKNFAIHNIEYSINQYPWKILENLYQNQRYSRFESRYQSNESMNKEDQKIKLKQQYQKVKKIQSEFQQFGFDCIHSFLYTIGLNPFQQKTEPTSLLKGLISLNGQEYKKRYVLDIAQVAQQNVNNLKFYFGDLKIRYNKMSIQDLHLKYGEYNWLEQTHDYIQWMFPNHYYSNFNGASQALSYFEAKVFQTDLKLGELMYRSIEIYFDFAGISISKNFELEMISRERLKGVLIFHTHNHLRIMRILACLSVTGFRIIALNFISFLQFVVNNDKDFQKIREIFGRDWKVYDDSAIDSQGTQKNQGLLEKAKQMCFVTDQYFPQTHPYLRTIYEEKTDQKEENKPYTGSIKRQQNGFYNQKDLSNFVSIKQQKIDNAFDKFANPVTEFDENSEFENKKQFESDSSNIKQTEIMNTKEITKNQGMQNKDNLLVDKPKQKQESLNDKPNYAIKRETEKITIVHKLRFIQQNQKNNSKQN